MSIEGTVSMAKANDSVLEETRDEKIEMMDVKNETLKYEYQKAEKIREDAKTNALFGALGSIGKAISSIF